ncbi:glycosyltransferase family 9 protein [Anseongella ginsenosidimutans]|nr:glycosyltransferase family 9 protein [Anseongella ginsenosidimutans]
MKRNEPDLLIQLHGNGSIINPLMKMMSKGLVAGYFQPGAYCPDARLFMPYPEGIPEIKRHLKLMEFLNISPAEEDLEFPIRSEEESEYGELIRAAGLEPGNYICIHAGARHPKRRWEPEKFARVADVLAAKGYTIVLTGTLPEKETAAKVAGNMRANAIDLTGKTSLGALAALIRDAALLFSNDTGLSHIAAAMKTPSVVIFLTSEPGRWAPLNRILHRVVLPEESDNTAIALFNADEALSEQVLSIKKERIQHEL